MSKDTHAALVEVLGEFVRVLHPHQASRAAQAIRELPGDESLKQLYGSLADSTEQEVRSRPLREARESGATAPDPVGSLEQEVVDAVETLPQKVRGMMFNVHGESLVYGTDDVLYHSDVEWQGYTVDDGKVPGLILSGDEAAFVEALWAGSTEVRAAKAAAADDQSS